MHKRLLFSLILVLSAGVVLAGGGQESGQAGQAEQQPLPDGLVASVNGVEISEEEYEQAVTQTQDRLAQQGQPVAEGELETLRADVLDQLIAEELLYQEAQDQGIALEEGEVDSQIQQMRAQFDSDEGWQQALETNGVTEEELREQIGRNALIQQLISTAVPEPGEVTEDEIQDFYDENPEFFEQGEQISARHILIDTQELESEAEIEDARQRAEDVRQELIDGADFATVAQERSEGPSATRGGDLGTFGRGQMVPAFEEAAFALEEDEISQVVESEFGFHVIQVTEKMESGLAPVDQVSQSIRQYLGQQKQADALDGYVEELREEADVRVNG
ncbi:MAG: peptidylprolyl isomerase [Spirochaetota bacterium]